MNLQGLARTNRHCWTLEQTTTSRRHRPLSLRHRAPHRHRRQPGVWGYYHHTHGLHIDHESPAFAQQRAGHRGQFVVGDNGRWDEVCCTRWRPLVVCREPVSCCTPGTVPCGRTVLHIYCWIQSTTPRRVGGTIQEFLHEIRWCSKVITCSSCHLKEQEHFM